MKLPVKTSRRWITRFRLWSRRVGLNRKLAIVLVVASVLSGLATLATMTGVSLLQIDIKFILMLWVDAVLLLLLGVVVAWRVVAVWAERRRGMAGSRLHIRLVVMFSLVAVTPAILVAVFSALFLNFGLQTWFSEQVRTAIEDSLAVANAYLLEHQQNIRSDIFAMANDLNRNAPVLVGDPGRFSQLLSAQASWRSLSEALVIDSAGQVLARSELSFSLEFDLVSPRVMEQAGRGEIVILTSDREDRVRAMVRLNRFVDAYLLVGRLVDPQILIHIERAETAVAHYQDLEKRQEFFQFTFVTIFALVTLLLLTAAVWLGLTLANQLARPISNLISAAERMRGGDLTARVDASPAGDEIGTLSRSFNRMASQLEGQRQGLIDANLQLDQRRRFTETVLAGVSAGVIGLNAEGRIDLPNRSASVLLDTELDACQGQRLDDPVPEMGELLALAMDRPDRLQQSHIKLVRRHQMRTLLVRIAGERVGRDVVGYVVTFDDITELLSAQRKAAWADIARRIAHEMKNPLTPIQLSAERLKRKYLEEIKSDPQTFAYLTETIVRQVEDIGRMVDEFSSFARMPQPSLKPENLSEICRQAVFMERNRHPSIEFSFENADNDVHLRCDGQQIGRALTNLLKNAAESIVSRGSAEGVEEPSGHVRIDISDRLSGDGHSGAEEGGIVVAVEDDGRGLPRKDRDRLTEPYVTTRDKGTGLGLAIVKKIMEDHNGDLVLEDRDGGGARVLLVFHPTQEPSAGEEEKDGMADQEDPMTVATRIRVHGS